MTDASATPTPLPQIKQLGPRFLEFVQGLDRPVVFLDIESTGTDGQRDRIIELSLLRVSPDPVAIETPRTWRIDPKQRIPLEASEIHGIFNEDLEGCPTFADLAEEIAGLLRGVDLAGFAISRLDLRLLKAEFARTTVKIDLTTARLVDAQVIFHTREPRNLAAAVEFYCGETLENAHGAEADTIASLKVFAGQLERYGDLSTGVPALDELNSSMNAAFVDETRRFMWKDGEPAFNFGKLKGKPLRWAAGDPEHRGYMRRLLQGTLEGDAYNIVVDALNGKIRRKGA